MSHKNKRNILYFKGKSMRDLYERMQGWQNKHNKRFLSVSIQKDGNAFCCIALTNPCEVVITDLDGDCAHVTEKGYLQVYPKQPSEVVITSSDGERHADVWGKELRVTG